jgi:hypothetical protein
MPEFHSELLEQARHLATRERRKPRQASTTDYTVSAPWARDANGASLSTSYRLDGNAIIQTVDHQGAGVCILGLTGVAFIEVHRRRSARH